MSAAPSGEIASALRAFRIFPFQVPPILEEIHVLFFSSFASRACGPPVRVTDFLTWIFFPTARVCTGEEPFRYLSLVHAGRVIFSRHPFFHRFSPFPVPRF